MNPRDPSPEEIAAACLLIQSEWTPQERMRRLRVDLRPCFTLADGRQQDIEADVYDGHHTQRAELVEGGTSAGPIPAVQSIARETSLIRCAHSLSRRGGDCG